MVYSWPACVWAISSAGERCLHTAEVAGSIPASPTQKERLLADRSNSIGRNPDVAAVLAATLEFLGRTHHLEVFDADVELGTIPNT